MTLMTKQGNSFDQASLLIALFRASGIPARYVMGTIEVPIEQAMNWTGVKDPKTAVSIFMTNGIPAIGITKGGKLVGVRMEHTWVEAYVDYFPYRGAVNGPGDTWVALDPCLKQYNRI
jgi:transglutaminase-like putative cysteine protease